MERQSIDTSGPRLSMQSFSLRGYKKIILNKEGDESDWAKNEWEILNDLAYAELMIACQDDMCFRK
jgi:hypothetical protein